MKNYCKYCKKNLINKIRSYCSTIDIKNISSFFDYVFVSEAMNRYLYSDESESYEDLIYDLEYKINNIYGFDISDELLYNKMRDYIDTAFTYNDSNDNPLLNCLCPYNGDAGERILNVKNMIQRWRL